MKTVHPWFDHLQRGVREKAKNPILSQADYFRMIQPPNMAWKVWKKSAHRAIGIALTAEWDRLRQGTLDRVQQMAQEDLAAKVENLVTAGGIALNHAMSAFNSKRVRRFNKKIEKWEMVVVPAIGLPETPEQAAQLLSAARGAIAAGAGLLGGRESLLRPTEVRGKLRFNDEPGAAEAPKPAKGKRKHRDAE